MTDIKRMFTSLSHEVDPVNLAPPEALRRKGDRRSRVLATALGVAVAVIAGAVAIGGVSMLSTRGAPIDPGIGSPTPSASPSATIPREIPATAFLHLADTNGHNEPGEWSSDNMLPQLCAATYASDGLVQLRRTMHFEYWATPPEAGTLPDGTFDETITMYEQDGADQFMQQLRAAVTACPTEQRDGTTYQNRIVAGATRGDDSVLIERRYPTRDPEGNPVGGDDIRLVSVVRVGTVVMVLYELGWEAGWSADQQVVDTFTGKAFARLQHWLGGG